MLNQQIIDKIKQEAEEIYSPKVFTMTDDDFEKFKIFLNEHGYSVDGISGYYGRIFLPIGAILWAERAEKLAKAIDLIVNGDRVYLWFNDSSRSSQGHFKSLFR